MSLKPKTPLILTSALNQKKLYYLIQKTRLVLTTIKYAKTLKLFLLILHKINFLLKIVFYIK